MSPVANTLACRLAKVCDCTYYIDKPGGITTCPFYDDVGFSTVPKTFSNDPINACCVGTFDDQVVLAFRGTLPLTFVNWQAFMQSLHDWLNDATAALVAVDGIGGKVHKGFSDTLLQLWPLFGDELQTQLQGGKPLYVTGHSKGGAVAVLAASRLAGLNVATAAQVLTYAAPRAGDATFAQDYQSKLPNSWRYEYQNDLVPHLPPQSIFLEVLRKLDSRFNDVELPEYDSVGTLEFIDWDERIDAGDNLVLQLQRIGHLAQVFGRFDFQQFQNDHSLEASYIPTICKP